PRAQASWAWMSVATAGSDGTEERPMSACIRRAMRRSAAVASFVRGSASKAAARRRRSAPGVVAEAPGHVGGERVRVDGVVRRADLLHKALSARDLASLMHKIRCDEDVRKECCARCL